VQLRIATWNIERLKHESKMEEILSACNQRRADILVLTETDARVHPDYRYYAQTPALAEIAPDYYKKTENRVSIYTNFPCVHEYETYDKYTAACVEVETDRGNLLVYGTIIGIHGNRRRSFQQDLEAQIEDWKRLSEKGCGLCIAGDYNCSFCDGYYYTKKARNDILRCFSDNGISLLTREKSECIDHIAVSSRLIVGNAEVEEWNFEKTLSDHKGVMATF